MHSLRLQLCTLLIGVWLGQAAKLHNEMTADELARLLGSKSLDEIPDYDLVTPFQVDEHGSFHSNDLSTIHLRTRRSDYHLVKDVPAHFKVPAFGDVHHLAVSPNNELLSPGFILQVHLENGKINTQYEYTHSQYVGTVRGDEDSHVAISNHGGNLMGVIITANVTLMLQPLPDHHSTGSEANPDNHTHIVYKRQANDDLPTPPYGLARGCDVNESIPAEDYREAKKFGKVLRAIRRGEDLPPGVNQSVASGINQQYVVEAIVVGDQELLRKWNYNVNNVKYYIITLMNIASSMYNKNKLGYDVRLILTRIALFQSETAQRNQRLYISRNSKPTLESFCDWQARTKPAANSELTYDHAFLFTGYGLCFGRNEDCWELGRAWVQGMCRDKYACSVNAEKGMQLGFVFAHELGHNLGMSHDGANGRCRAEDGYVMKSSTGLAQRIYLWSSCSRNYLLSYLSKGDTQCLLDKPKHFFSSFGKDYYRTPGSIYTVDQQCKFSFGSQATYCRKETREYNVCDRLYCDDKDWPRCVTTYTGAAEGTPCGDQKVCYDRRCVDKNRAPVPQLPDPSMFNPRVRYNDPDGPGVAVRVPGPPGTRPTSKPTDPPTPGCIRDPSRATVHGQWSGWSAPSVCSRSCGGGFQRQDRFCDRPAPQNCGQECFGDSTRYTMCNTQTCQDKTDDRLQQCQEYSSSVPKGVVLVPNYEVAEADRCKLSCKSSSDVKYTLIAAEARDGTTCDRDTNDRCLLGKCVSVGCDNIMGSAKKFDRCGVCGGNGANCAPVKGVYNIKQQWQGYHTVTTLPAKARDIVVKGSEATSFALFDTSDKRLFRFVSNSQSFSYGNVVFRYTAKSPRIEASGQLSKAVVLKLYRNGRNTQAPDIEYSYYLSPSVVAKDSKYEWAVVPGPCSVTCGAEEGVQSSVAECRKKSDGTSADKKNCDASTSPPSRRRRCNQDSENVVPCPAPAAFDWFAAPYGECSKACGNGVKQRTVTCRNTKTRQVVDNDECDAATKLETETNCSNGDCLDKSKPVCKLLLKFSTCRKKIVRYFCPGSCESA